MGEETPEHGVLIPLGPEHQHAVQPNTAPKAATAQTPLGGRGCHAAQDRATGQSEAQMRGPGVGGGVPHTDTVARVPAHTCMHTVIHTCARAPHQHSRHPVAKQENPLSGAHTCPYHAGLPTATQRSHRQTPRLTHTYTLASVVTGVWCGHG